MSVPWRADASPLPVPLSRLVGRAREVAMVVAMLARPDLRLLTLTGPGGVGKTRLALAVGADVADAFDGVRFVPLASVRDAGLVAGSIAQAIDVKPIADSSTLDALASALRALDILLVIDNFEHVLAAAPVLSALLARCPRLKILVTSRVLLRVAGEQALAVPPLMVPDALAPTSFDDVMQSSAVQLFVERAQAAEASFVLSATTAPQVAEICRRVDGLPLAIELVAPRVRHLALPELLTRLDQRLPLLTGGSRDHPRRLQTMRNAIAWSHDVLAPAEQVLFRRLAVSTGGFSLEAAEYVGREEMVAPGADEQVDAPAVFDRLASLIDASLVQIERRGDGGARYRMLETIREFALERLESSGEEASVQRAHATYFLALAERYELADLLPDGDRILELLEGDHANFRAALTWLDENGEAGSLMRLAAALGEFWTSRGDYREGHAWLERVVAFGSGATTVDRAKALVHLGRIEIYQGANRQDEGRLTAGLADCRLVGDMFRAGMALLLLDGLAIVQGDYASATALLEESLAAAHELADQRLAGILAGWALINLAVVARSQGDHALAAERLAAGLRCEREAGHVAGIIMALGDLGEVAREQGDLWGALGWYREALGLVRGSPGTRVVTEVIETVGIAAIGVGQAERGVRLLGASEAQRGRIGLRFRLAITEAALQPAIASARAALGDAAFAAAWSAGRTLRPGQAIAEALQPFAVPTTAVRATLTPREAEILQLLAAGRTDPDIAAALFLSVRTVEHHVAHVLAKLGVRTRTAAVAAAIAADLVAGSEPPA